MIYCRKSLQHLLKDVKNYIKAPLKPSWCLVTSPDGQEYKDENFWITDGFALWLVPSDRPTRFRMEFEEDLTKMRAKNQIIRQPSINAVRRLIISQEDYVEATDYGLYFHPRSGFSVEGKTGDTTSILDIKYLYAFDELLRNMPELEDYTMYIHKSLNMQIVCLGKENNIRAYVAPLLQEKIAYD